MNANLTYQPSLHVQLCALPDGVIGEILGGQLHSMPRPSDRHDVAERALTTDLSGPYGFGCSGTGGAIRRHRVLAHRPL